MPERGQEPETDMWSLELGSPASMDTMTEEMRLNRMLEGKKTQRWGPRGSSIRSYFKKRQLTVVVLLTGEDSG